MEEMTDSRFISPCEIVVATRNLGKLKELAAILASPSARFLSLKEFPKIPEIVEDGKTFSENALLKAKTVARLTGRVAVADDSGLTVDALGGRPGIFSSRYAGEHASDEDRYRKLLKEMESIPEGKRGGAFVCAAAVASPSGIADVVEAEWRGAITFAPRGANGFGYDPVFFIPGENKTVAELTPDLKNRISHRAHAFEMLKRVLPRYLATKP
jgi:XTP/dITP diphosphohydrolase